MRACRNLLVVASFSPWVALVGCSHKGNSASTTESNLGGASGVFSTTLGGTPASTSSASSNTSSGGAAPLGTASGGTGDSIEDTSLAVGSSRDFAATGGKGSVGGTLGILTAVEPTGGTVATTMTGGSSIDVMDGGKSGLGGSSAVPSSTAIGGTVAALSSSAPATGGVNSTGGTTSTTVDVANSASVDVVFMIDNSGSMADKQGVLATSLPSIVNRLVQPYCLDAAGAILGTTGLDGSCAAGRPQFKPVTDLHIGVITSSLGDHGGGDLCTPGTATSFTDESGNPLMQPADVNDASHLMGSLTRGAAALTADTSIVQSNSVKIDPKGFLSWVSGSQTLTGTDSTTAQHVFSDMVHAVGEKGCGFEAQLESWFRFLIDPVPPVYPITKDVNNQTQRVGVDDALLLQRQAFLRPNSIVVVVMLTDENDCSLRDTDVGWIAANARTSVSTGSAVCQTNPNDRCCYMCTGGVPSGCTDSCPAATTAAQDDSAYQVNIRCWHQKRRFGFDFMYPTSRYVVGLTKPELCPDQTFGDMDCNCAYATSVGAQCSPGTRRLPNPLYSGVVGQNSAGQNVPAASQALPRASNSRVFLAGIVGVPWQDLGYADSSGKLTYIPVTDPVWVGSATMMQPVTPAPSGIWSLIYGNDDANIVPGDAHMRESLDPRTGLPSPTAAPDADPITGHEWNTAYQDLQYACIFKLPDARPCLCDSSNSAYSSCKYLHSNDCCDLTYSVDGRGTSGNASDFDKPLCQGRTQIAAKSYPGLREIAVLHDYAVGMSYAAGAKAGNSIVTSICPKDMTGDTTNAAYGYNPATDAIVARIAEQLPKH